MSKDHTEAFREEFGHRGEILAPLPNAAGGNAFRVRTQNGKTYYAYEFPHPSVAATVVLYDVSKQAYLLVKRSNDPYAGHYAFPGGFLEVGEEEIEDAAVRELFEEAGVTLEREKLELIDVRSHPSRDPRDHVFDIAYYAEEEDVEALVGDEVSAFLWASADEIDDLPLAFDHDVLWIRVKNRFLG